jgi:hypothetical protein
LLDGEVMLTSTIAKEYRISQGSAQQAVRLARDWMREDSGVVLPVANWHGNYKLETTTEASVAFRGEVPQLRALRTRHQNALNRLGATMALARWEPTMAAMCLRGLEAATDNFEASIDTAVEYMMMVIRQDEAEA